MPHTHVIVKQINQLFNFLLSHEKKQKVEKIVFITAILAFLFHLALIALARYEILPYPVNEDQTILNPLMAIYTPFTIILLYEIYSLIYYLPKSITVYLGKQYEIIVLILIRQIFNDLANISTHGYFNNSGSISELMITFAGLIVFCLLIFCFYKVSGDHQSRGDEMQCSDISQKKYVIAKKVLALILLGIFIALLIKSVFFFDETSFTIHDTIYLIKKMNEMFFNTFFIALIIMEVMLLLLSFNLTEKFHKIIRNSGFIISTILLKMSFRTEGLTNILIIFTAIAFGVAILMIYKLFDRKLFRKKV